MAEERELDRDIAANEVRRQAFMAQVASDGISDRELLRLVAMQEFDNARAQIVQNHNSTAMAANMKKLREDIGHSARQSRGVEILILVAVVAHAFGFEVQVIGLLVKVVAGWLGMPLP